MNRKLSFVKKLYQFMMRSFMGPFIMTFFIAIFILLMQFLWKYIDDLVGKGLAWSVIGELMYYASLTFVPMGLPLAMLLSSLMTFGNLGENYELAAIKASGISLQKVMRPLIIASLFISLTAFQFSNRVLPWANLKMGSLLHDVRDKKPAVDIEPGVFYKDIDNYVIKIGQKDKDGVNIRDILIYDHTRRMGNINVTMAESGQMEFTADKRHLIFRLKNGVNYTESRDKKEDIDKLPMQRTKFKSEIRYIDLSDFDFEKTNEDLFRNHYKMMDISQLSNSIDSLNSQMVRKKESFNNYIATSFRYKGAADRALQNLKPLEFPEDSIFQEDSLLQSEIFVSAEEIQTKEEEKPTKEQLVDVIIENDDSLELVLDYEYDKDSFIVVKSDPYFDSVQFEAILTHYFRGKAQGNITTQAINTARNNKNHINYSRGDFQNKREQINKHVVEGHKKFTLAIACMILFFVGAPLGAIIRKGGLGMPVVVATILFVLYHVISMIGEKSAKESGIDPVIGTWLASLIFLPVGIFLMIKATSDSKILEVEFYSRISKTVKKLFSKKEV